MLHSAGKISLKFFRISLILALVSGLVFPSFAQQVQTKTGAPVAPSAPAPAQTPASPAVSSPAQPSSPAINAPGAPQGQPAAPPKPAEGQPQPRAPQPPKQLVGTTTGWVRVCQKVRDTDKEGCSIKQDVVAENGAFLATLAVQEVTGEERRQVIITTPLGMALQAGLLLRIDEEKAVPAKFGTCLVNGCFAGLEINMDMIDRMKKGKNAFITVRNIQGAALDLTVPLTTFGKAYDGPATDVQALQQQQKKLQEELLKRAEKAREELLKQQSGGVPPATTK